jgi:hypothetical protein
VRAIKATTISILAIGLLAGSAVGVAAQDGEAAAGATSFTGTAFGVTGGPDPEPTVTDLGSGLTAVDGFVYWNTWETSDERLTGDVIGVVNQVVDPGSSEAGGLPDILMSEAIEVTNDGGSWLGEGKGFGSTDLDFVKGLYTLVGQGGYEGLTAYVFFETTGREPALSGIIFPTAMPEAPEPYTGE